MGYQNVGTPRFYIDYLQYARATGNALAESGGGTESFEDNQKRYWKNHIGLNSSGNTFATTNTHGKVWISPIFINPLPLPRNDIMDGTSTSSGMFTGCLGHNATSAYGGGMSIDVKIASSNGLERFGTDSQIVNWEAREQPILLDGFSLMKKTNLNNVIDIQGVYFRFYVGSEATASINLFAKTVVFGQYFNLHSPDLSLTMSHEYDGLKTVETKGGTTLSDIRYHKAPMWGGDLEAWQLGDWNQLNSGRRVWDLSFSYLSASDIEPYNPYGVEYQADTGATLALEGTDNWFTNVLYYTNGGQLPFIFQPDKDASYDEDTYTVPELAICRFDMDTFTRTQVANGVYNMKIKIVESW